jgi:hypothetical protein
MMRRLMKAMERHFKRWIILGLSVAFMVLAVKRLDDEGGHA